MMALQRQRVLIDPFLEQSFSCHMADFIQLLFLSRMTRSDTVVIFVLFVVVGSTRFWNADRG